MVRGEIIEIKPQALVEILKKGFGNFLKPLLKDFLVEFTKHSFDLLLNCAEMKCWRESKRI